MERLKLELSHGSSQVLST